MPDVVPFNEPGLNETCHASAAVTGGRFVAISGTPVEGNPRVAPAGAGVAVFGVAAHDAAIGEKVLVYTGPGVQIPVLCPGALSANAILQSDATGGAIARTTGVPAGRLLADVAAGANGRVEFLPALI